MDDIKIRNMEEFARISGISRPTVSKYFNDPTSVRDSTRARIEKALAEFDYRPNIFAMNQNRQLTKNVGIVVPFLADPFFAEIARKIEEHCIAAGFRPTLYSSHGQSALETDILESLRSLKPAGVLMAPLGRTSDIGAIERFCANVPTVLFDSNIDDLGLAFVGSDNWQFCELLVDFLCRTGEPPCYLEMKDPPNPNTDERREGYVRAMEARGHAPQIVQIPGEGWALEEIGRRGGREALDSGAFGSNTVLCCNDRLAIGLLAACYEKGLKVGHAGDCDIRIAGQDDHPFSRFTCPPLTTVSHDYEAISTRSVETLFALADKHGDSIPRSETRFEGRLIMRASA